LERLSHQTDDVLDFKSWPGGKLKHLGKGAGSAGEWPKLLKAYQFKNDEEAVAYRGNPVDNLKPLADAKIPLLLVFGDKDDAVPHDENSLVAAGRYEKLGGSLQLIAKLGIGHHPHGLTNPAPIVEFILKHAIPSK
jgi:pimeloyl-ACP methyl ester carboxylesterase